MDGADDQPADGTAGGRPGHEPTPGVEVVAARAEWSTRFDAERVALDAAVGPLARSIEHIGSTAVPGLASKPTVDILLVVEETAGFLAQLDRVEALGYEFRPRSFENDEEHLFLRKVVDGRRLFHLHVLRVGSPEITDYRLFRDALRRDPDLAAGYERLKLELAARHADDRARYVAAKETWVTEALERLRSEVASATPVYDRIGTGYAGRRIPEPTWARQILAALGDAETVLNVGAGTGNYEPTDRSVVAVEPSSTMLAQRSGPNPAVQGVAEQLPFPDGTFDAALATFTVHHWADQSAGLRELRRVARRQVLVVFEPLAAHRFWLVDYFPEIPRGTAEANAPAPLRVAADLDVVDVQTLWIPADCCDGLTAAHWRRPEAYLDADVQRSMSSLALLPDDARARGTARLAVDLADGTWVARHGHLLDQDRADYGYRLVIAEG